MEKLSPPGKTASIANVLLLALATLWVFSVFSGPISSADFWWHLKSGQHIIETKSLPATDPFSFTTEWDPLDEPTERNKIFTLRQAWLGQVIMYGIYRLFSFEGIIYLRAAILTILMMLLYRVVRREGTGLRASLFLVFPAVIVFSGFTAERPQLFSFLFFALIVFLLEGFRKKAMETRELKPTATNKFSLSSVYYLLPTVFIMLLWANIHGGFFLGIILLSSYFSAELIKHITKRFGAPLPAKSLRALGMTTIISSLCALINPNGYTVFIILLERRHGLYRYLVSETVSTVEHIRLGLFGPELIAFILLLALCLVLFLVHIRRMDLTDAMTIALFAGLSVYLFRLIPFFTPLAALFLARYGMKIDAMPFRRSVKNIPQSALSARLNSKVAGILLSSMLSLLLIFSLTKGSLFGGLITTNLFHRSDAIVAGKFPQGAVNFLKDTKISGNLFNPLDWGGYIMWRLSPDYKVFIDGRGLNEKVVIESAKVMAGSGRNEKDGPEWKAILDRYRVSVILTYSVEHFTGRLLPLIPAIINDPQWELIYADDTSLLFVKDIPENGDILREFALPKERVWHEVISEARAKSRGYFGRDVNVNFLITTGDAYLSLKQYQSAMAAYAQAWRIDPNNQTAISRLQFLNSMFQ